MKVKIYVDSVAPANLLDEVDVFLPGAPNAEIQTPLVTRSYPVLNPGFADGNTHIFLFTVTAAPNEVSGGNTCNIPVVEGRISAMPFRIPT